MSVNVPRITLSTTPLLIAVWGLLLAGCNDAPTGEIVPTVPASGVVTYQGKPLENYRVLLQSEGQRPATGHTDAEGQFTLGTNGQGDGAPVGTHQVAIRYVGPPDYDPGAGSVDFQPLPPPKVKLPPKFSDPAKSGLTVEISEGGNTEIVLDLK